VSYIEVPPIIFNDTQHYVAPDKIAKTACGILYEAEDWTTEGTAHHFCWQCMKVGNLYEEIKQLRKVLDAAVAWREDPDAGPQRGALANAIEFFHTWESGDFGLEDEE
jgi:hypothetical protein